MVDTVLNRISAHKVLSIAAIVLQTLIVAALGKIDGYGAMCVVSVLQLIFLVSLLAFSPSQQFFVILFLIANWVFHCGQIACIANGHVDALNLDFRMYGSSSTIADAFRFYLYSQSLIALGSVLLQAERSIGVERAGEAPWPINKKLAWTLVITGVPFWLYVNLAKLTGASAEGYYGVYSLVIPAPIQAVSFFFESGLLMFLLLIGRERKGSVLFWLFSAVKVVLMSTGGRQDSVCFLAVWCLVYFGYLQKLSPLRTIVLVASVVALLYVTDAFGELRNDGFSFDAFVSYLSHVSLFDVIWDSLGEFGSAFSTLVVSMANIPTILPYGMGSTYLAGIMSIIPKLVSNFASLQTSTLFTTAIPGTDFFGGSMLGEFYYNFSWLGLVGLFVMGCILAWCQNRLNLIGRSGCSRSVWLAAVLSIFLLLFIRGYFSDMVMKLVYLCVFTWMANDLIKRLLERRVQQGIVKTGERFL